jgi:cytochrome c5
MASKRAKRRRQCDGKVRFTDEENAKEAALRRSKATGTWIAPYKCEFCHAWHIGHMPWFVKKAIQKRREEK